MPTHRGPNFEWTPAAERFLRAKLAAGWTDRRIASALGCYDMTVRRNREAAGLAGNNHPRREEFDWGPDDDATVRAGHAGGLTDSQIAAALGRGLTNHNVRSRRKQLGLAARAKRSKAEAFREAVAALRAVRLTDYEIAARLGAARVTVSAARRRAGLTERFWNGGRGHLEALAAAGWDRPVGLTPGKVRVLAVLTGGPLTAAGLAAAIGGGVRPAAVMLNKLAALGLVCRTDDRRGYSTPYLITAPGLDALAAVAREQTAVIINGSDA